MFIRPKLSCFSQDKSENKNKKSLMIQKVLPDGELSWLVSSPDWGN